MAKANGKVIAFSVVAGTTLILATIGTILFVKSATSQTNVEAGSPIGATTVEGAVTSGPVGAAVAVDDTNEPVECNFSEWVGQSASQAEASAKATGRAYRMIAPGTPVTMDYRADRINIELNDAGTVTKVTCG